MSDVNAHTEVEMGSNRSFGLVFAAVFALIAFWPVLGGGPVRIWALIIAAVFLALSFLAPDVLRPLNRLWFQFGMLLSKIVSPIVMGIIFFVTVTPIGLIRRIRHPDPLNQTFDPAAESYWIDRDKADLAPTSMRKQF
ncbi:SxtJ family membrane protein [Sedimentitalea sp. HM32M-2]|uniref:SxtJ family membrane protein n=1 Tax=Sedimentitalea sp. HM32M-2 TaxID=3351566 RepID=UPI0036449EAD